jgi:spermidine synthase
MSVSRPQEPAAALSSRWAWLVYVLFFLSGLTSLVYEVIWVRNFGLVFGVTTYAVSTVLAAFFAGLALGSYVAGRLIDRTRVHPLVIYGAMEAIIGAYALLLPAFLRLVESTYPTVYARLAEDFSLFTLFRFIVCFALLAIPTTLMGATLPILSKLMVDREDVLGLKVGHLYAVNTFGAVTGTFLAGFLLVKLLGVPNTTLAAAIGNFLLAVAAGLLSRLPLFRAGLPDAVQPPPEVPPLRRADRIILALAFVSGLAILALEVLWTKSLVLILGSTTYAFSTMLTAVLVGIAVGSAAFARYADAARNRAALAAALLFGGGLCAVLGPAIINRLPFWFLRLADWTAGDWNLYIASQFAVCFALVFVPTFLSGASFPILVRMHSRGVPRVGRTVSDIYAINTLGGIIGSLVGGFVLVRCYGLAGSVTVASLCLMLVGGPLAVALAKPWRRDLRTGVGAVMVAVVTVLAFAHPRLDTKLLFGSWGPFAGGYYLGQGGGTTVNVTERYMQRLLYHREGVSASVDVFETGWGTRVISINAQPVATTYLYDMRALKMLGHLPVLLHPDPKQVLLIGLGAGVASGIIGNYPSVDHVTVAELNEEVPEGTARFADWNFGVRQNPKVSIVINDGANFVKATRKQYDIIGSDPIHPFILGNGTLYSVEHWRVCRDRLRPGGLLVQWIPLYQISPTDLATIVRTFMQVFPNATLWYCGIDGVLVGSKGEFRIGLDRLAHHIRSSPEMAADLLTLGAQQPGDVLGWYVAGPEQLARMGSGAPINRVDRPVLEYTAPKALSYTGVSATVPALLAAAEEVPIAELRTQLEAVCTRRLHASELAAAASGRLATIWVLRGQLLISNGYTGQYLDALERARAIRPTDRFIAQALSEAQRAAAWEQADQGYPAQAFRLYREAFANDPTAVEGLTGAVQAALDTGDLAAAERTLALAAPAQKQIFQVLVYTGLVALRRSNYQLAASSLRAAAARGQESPAMHIGLGLVALRDGARERATDHFRRAIRISTDVLESLFSIVDTCVAHGFSTDARPYAERLVEAATAAIAAAPGSPIYYDYRALAYTLLGAEDMAARDRITSRSLVGWWKEPGVTSPALVAPQR